MAAPADLTVIANPISGWGKGKRFARALLKLLQGSDLPHQLYWTEGPGHARILAETAVAQGARTVVCVGGDGTIHEAIQALAGRESALLAAPAGRCNDFAKAIGPLPSPEGVVKALQNPVLREMDLAKAGGLYFATVGATGFDAQVAKFVDQTRLPVKGFLAYLIGIIKILARYQPSDYHIRWQHGQFRGPLLMASVGNTPTYGNEIPITPEARPDDGLLDLCLVRPVGFFRAMTLLHVVKTGKHGRLPIVSFHKSPWVEIAASPQVEMWSDGEAHTTTPLRVEVAPGALRVVTPPAL